MSKDAPSNERSEHTHVCPQCKKIIECNDEICTFISPFFCSAECQMIYMNRSNESKA